MNRVRDKQFNIRLTKEELAAFEKKRTASGLGKTDFFVKMVRDTDIKVYLFDDDVKAIMHELRKIGVNLNQVAYLANTFQSDKAQTALRYYQNSFCAAMDRLSAFLDKPLTEG
ncbi:plasmid mobilization protein [Ruminococcus albus]|uniref:Mobilization protein n=1 Tax=Ruminococcus albus (strain ATCC 27210 / DSM 20455 / JCM 14654 / NCDO 2250 / 7) TaxID=697329 RepID=E6UCW2_RUMA7|nr:plasmid mobilization relaxosome protein MobC [Ruminococcus albus]ADU22791.1 mobilization protein [Ruminococcus albus 7 = DSM 20455]